MKLHTIAAFTAAILMLALITVPAIACPPQCPDGYEYQCHTVCGPCHFGLGETPCSFFRHKHCRQECGCVAVSCPAIPCNDGFECIDGVCTAIPHRVPGQMIVFPNLEFGGEPQIPLALEGAPTVYFTSTYLYEFKWVGVLYGMHCGDTDAGEMCAEDGKEWATGGGPIRTNTIHNPRGEIRYLAEKLRPEEDRNPMKLTVYTNEGINGIRVYYRAETTGPVLDLTFALTK